MWRIKFIAIVKLASCAFWILKGEQTFFLLKKCLLSLENPFAAACISKQSLISFAALLSTRTHLLMVFIAIFFRYFSFKNIFNNTDYSRIFKEKLSKKSCLKISPN